MITLKFNVKDVRAVIADAKRAAPGQRRATFGQLTAGGAYDKDLKPVEGKWEEIQKGLEPEIHLVHDKGIYLMPNAWFKGISIAYAIGCNPKTDSDIWDHITDVITTDVPEPLSLAYIENAIDHRDATHLVLQITDTEITISAERDESWLKNKKQHPGSS